MADPRFPLRVEHGPELDAPPVGPEVWRLLPRAGGPGMLQTAQTAHAAWGAARKRGWQLDYASTDVKLHRCVTPTGRTDGHGRQVEILHGVMVCSFCSVAVIDPDFPGSPGTRKEVRHARPVGGQRAAATSKRRQKDSRGSNAARLAQLETSAVPTTEVAGSSPAVGRAPGVKRNGHKHPKAEADRG